MPRPVRRMPRSNAMIVAPQPEAVHAGAAVLANGGNAMDAVLTCAFVQGVVDPLMCGIGGFGLMNVYDPATGRQTIWSGLGGCPKAATDTMWEDLYIGETSDGFGHITKGFVNETGATAVTPPPILDLFRKAHATYGSRDWADLIAPAIAAARDGWLVRPHNNTVFTQNERKYGRMNYSEKLLLTEDGRRIYMDEDGAPKKMGATITNPDLAQTLDLIAREGVDVFFNGPLGDHLVAELAKNGGILTKEDLTDCHADEMEPLNIQYRGRRVSTVPAPGGGVYLALALKLLEQFDLSEMEYNSPEYLRLMAEVMKTAVRDRDNLVGDPRFLDVPTDKLLSDAHLADCAAFIRSGQKVKSGRSGHLESKHTTHVSCVDANGMVVSMTHTLGNPSGFIAANTGFMMNGAMSTFDPRPGHVQSIVPGKRRTSSMCPSIIFEGDTPVMTLGAPGASWIGPAVFQVVVNALDWGMGIQEAVMAPRMVATSNVIDISNRISPMTEAALVDLGYEVRRSPLSYAFAGVHGLTMWPDVVEGGADPQRDGLAVGVH
ncbi:gamma-glutamyltransferase family protein [Roseovarius mucosus]|uniref:gamma-glutamyltransferase family protein n=1 Tax=Roseovarius mucosus TaxID=215743 RepID=UPI001C5EB754|nr:gamma-glutamyltransferase family protein [Roseovarius mucosus]MBW4976348.1 gamma-glutamyltransferase family protein [Roseovarius mucosus]